MFAFFFYCYCFFSIVVHCKSLHAPPDGQVKPDSCRTYPEYDTTCHFSCSQGYRLRGEPIVTCLSDGLWSGNTTTFCKGWFIFVITIRYTKETYCNSQRKTHQIAQIRHLEPQKKRQYTTTEVIFSFNFDIPRYKFTI